AGAEAVLRPHRRRRPDRAVLRLVRHPDRRQARERQLPAHRRGHRPAAQGHPVPVRRGRGTGRGAGRRPAHGAGGPAAGLPGAAPWRRRARPYPGHQLHRDRPAAVAMRTARRATASGVLAILLWSSLALLTVATAGLPPFQVLATAFAVAAASGLLQAAWRGRAGLAGLHAPPAALALSTAGLFGYHAL